MIRFCPHCGFNLQADKIVQRDNFTLDPKGFVSWKDELVDVPKSAAILLHSLASTRNRILTTELLAERCGLELTSLPVIIYNLRKRLKKFAVPDPIQNQFGVGYFWKLQ